MQQTADERARWLAAVLIVAAIAATSLVVQFWPVRLAPAKLVSAELLPARSLRLVHGPVVVASAAASRVAMPVVPTITTPSETFEAPVLTAVRLALPPPVAAEVAPGEARVLTDTEPPLLASARINVRDAAPQPTPPVEERDDALTPYAIVELPAVAVTRAVSVAGRSIRVGLRATGAAFKAAF